MKSPLARFLSRRNLLKNAGLMAFLSPLIRQLDARAQAPVSPKRAILIFSPNGPMSVTGPASGTETAFTLHDWWKPLERHKAEGIFMSHMANTGAGEVNGQGHALGGQTYSGYGAGANGEQYAQNGETIDQVIAKRLEQEGRGGMVRSLIWGNVTNQATQGSGDAFAAGPGRNIVPETNPATAWKQLFAGLVAPTTPLAPGGERSVLDFVLADCESIQTALGSVGAATLDQHCTTLRSMEKNLLAPAGAGSACTRPAQQSDRNWTNPETRDQQVAAFTDLMAGTLACELSHLIAFQIGAQASRNRLPANYGVPSSARVDSGDSGPAHHPWTHSDDSPAKMDALRIFTTTYAEQVALLIDKLKATNDAFGKPLIDSTVVLWLSELGGSEGNQDPHLNKSVPAILFGNGQGTFRTGRYIKGLSQSSTRGAGVQAAQLLVSIIQYMGLTDVDTVGVTLAKGPLASLY